MRNRSRIVLVAVAFAALIGMATAQSTFRIAIGVDPDSLDPAQNTTTTVANVIDYVVQPLVTIDENGKLVPDLATSWSTSADGKTLTFDLRQGVTFQDGTPFDANAVKWNLDRLLDTNVRVPQRGQLTVIDSVDVVDAHTVRLNLKNPAPALVGAMSQTTAAMISPASATVSLTCTVMTSLPHSTRLSTRLMISLHQHHPCKLRQYSGHHQYLLHHG